MEDIGKAEVRLVLLKDNQVEAETRWIFIRKPQNAKEIYLEILDYLKSAGEKAATTQKRRKGWEDERKNKHFLYGKGHICQYCKYGVSSYRRKCVPLANVYNYTEIKQGITSFVIQVFDCKKFTMREHMKNETNV